MSFSNNKTLVTLLKVDYVSVIVNSVDFDSVSVWNAHAAHAKQIFVNGEDEKGKKEKYKDGSYKKYREKRGRQTAFVDNDKFGVAPRLNKTLSGNE